MMQFIRKHWLLIGIILVGLILRIYRPLELFSYDHDHDLAGWIVKDILFNHHLRFIGQETSSHGVFIGPYFYYALIPFYILTKIDPAGTILLPVILGCAAIFSVYFVFNKMFNEKVAILGSLIYAVSVLIVFTDREVVPTMPVVLWTIWFLFAISRILNGKKYGYLIVGLLAGFIWSINLQLVILLPLVLIAQIFSRKGILSLRSRMTMLSILIAVILNIPFVTFEVRHGFQQTHAIISSLTSNKDYVPGTARGFAKLDRVMQLVYKNTTSLYWDSVFNIPQHITFWGLLVVFVYLIKKKIVSIKLAFILFLWQLIYILFFTVNSINVSEYYLNGMNIIWILVACLGANELIQKKYLKILGVLIIGLFVILNLHSFISRPINASGYVERKAIINYIKEDATKNNYPCVSLSFITSPGNNLGYRYFTWELGLKTKPISKTVPVYSIVFPHSLVNKIDKSFGALGLVLPDYKRYNEKAVAESCLGDDYTVSQPMFGFTK